MVRRSNPSDLFLRWFMVVYLPLGLLAIQAALLPFGLLPKWMSWSLFPLAVYAVVAVRLLIERKRSGLGIPLPRKVLVSVAALSATIAIGLALFVLGMGRLDNTTGLTMVFVGGCLMILSVTVPTFRLVDIALRKSSRIAGRLLDGSRNGQGRGPRAVAPKSAAGTGTARPARKSSSRPVRPRAKPASGSTPRPKARVTPARTRTTGAAASPVLAKLGSAALAARRLAESRRGARPKPAARPPRGKNGPIGGLAVPPSPPQEP